MDQREMPDIVGARPPYPRLADRPDVLVFETAPVRSDVEVTGPMTVKLWISSTASDTDFTAKLIDVYPASADYPEGFALNLADSIIRVRYRDGWDHEVLLQPGQVTPVEIQLPPTSNLFVRGHRIRLDISSSNFPRFDVNPNTGEPVGRHTHSVVATNTVYFDRAGPSHVVLPVIA
jgi:putative CocE/NonD family hydrolase